MKLVTRITLSLVICCAFLTTGHAAPLVLVNPTNVYGFLAGTGTFQTLATVTTGSAVPTYQWQTRTSGLGTFANISAATSSVYSLTLSSTTLVGSQYRCVVTSSGSAVDTNYATIKAVYPTTSLESPTVTLTSGSTFAANYQGDIPIQITGLSTGETVRVERILDANGSGAFKAGDWLVQDFEVTDGVVAAYGGVPDLNVPSDDDGVANGQITTHFSLLRSPPPGQTAGTYLIRVTSPTGKFRAIQTTLTVTPASYGQSISGKVLTTGSVAVPYAAVVLMQPGGHGSPVALVLADGTGHYVVPAAPGSYNLMPVATGYVTNQSTAPAVVLSSGTSVTGINLTLTPPNVTIGGQLQDSGTGSSLPGILMDCKCSDGNMSLGMSDFDGNFLLSAVPDQWQLQPDSNSLPLVGYLAPNNKTGVSTSGTVSASGVNFVLTKATAIVTGTLTDDRGVAITGVSIAADDNNGNYWTDGVTGTNGAYSAGVLGNSGSSSSPVQWQVQVDDGLPAGYVSPQSLSFTPTTGSATFENLVAPRVTAYLIGQVTLSGTGVSGIQIGASLQTGSNGGSNSPWVQTTTDSSGNFSLGVNGGTWQIQLEQGNGNPANLIGPQVNEIVSGTTNITGISFPLIQTNAMVTGTVTNYAKQPDGNAQPYADATIGGLYYNTSVNTGSNGVYSMPLTSGTWQVGVNDNGNLSSYQDQTVIVTGTTYVNFTESFISQNPSSQSAPVGNSTNFNIGTNAPGPVTVQWQRQPGGTGTWSNLSGNSTYSGVTTNGLTVNNVTLAMNGDAFRAVVSGTYNGILVSDTSASAVLLVQQNSGNYVYTDANGVLTIVGYTGPGGAVSIPSSLSGVTGTVTGIGSWAFRGTGLTSVTFPSTVTSIGQDAFIGCSSLASVTIPSTVTSIGLNVFGGCTSLPTIAVSASNANYVSVGGILFNLSQTTLVQYPAGKSGSSYTIPSNVTTIADGAFFDCPGLTAIMVSASNSYFSSANGILFNNNASALIQYPAGKSGSSYMIPGSVSSVGVGAFAGCASLSSVTIPTGVSNIGYWAFYDCTSLGAAIFMGNAPSMGWEVFQGTGASFTVYYFDGTSGFSSPTWTDDSGFSWSSVNLGPYPASQISTWRLSYFGINVNNADISGDTVINNGAGITNLLAYALGANPITATVAVLPTVGTTPVSGTNYLKLSFTQNLSAADITFTVQGSSTLSGSNWSTISTYGGGTWSPSGNVTENSGTTTVQDTTPINSTPKRFLRLQITH